MSSKKELTRTLGTNPRELDLVLNRLSRFYRPKRVSKKDGTFRTLFIPEGRLKEIQRGVKRVIFANLNWPSSVQGGIKGRSVRSNAAHHVRKPLVIAMDVKNFFPSVTPRKVFSIFTRLGADAEVAGILTKLTTWNGQLPQGAPTSTDLANLALARVDMRIAGFCRQHGFSYSRYVDDITVSGPMKLRKFKNLLPRIIEEEGFLVKAEKTEIMPIGTRQLVTKVVVNEGTNLPREKRQQLRLEVVKQDSANLSPSLKGQINWLRYLNPQAAANILHRARKPRRDNEKGSC
jgi:RNA-directed DNA polymerase